MTRERRVGLRAGAVSAVALALMGIVVPAVTGAGRERPALRWNLELARRSEPGRPMILEGTVRDAGGVALPGFVFFVYQADARGRYGRPGPDSATARLAGFVKAGPQGQFRIQTILPGTYGGPPHLHFDFRDSLGAMRTTFLNLFPPEPGDYSAYTRDYPRSFRKSRPGRSRHEIDGPRGRLVITQPADLEVVPDARGVFRVRWDLDVSLSAPHFEHPGWGPEAPR